MTPTDHQIEIENFCKLLESKGLKFTYERRTTCEEILSLNQHFSADELYEILKKKGHRISRDTVYRTIPFLLESAVIQKSVGDGKGEFFERTSRKGHHDHMICLGCNKIIEFECKEIEELQEKIVMDHGFTLAYHDHRLFIHCKDCQKS